MSSRTQEPSGTSGTLAFLWGLGIGAALMFFLDPETGRRRRALVRDQCVRGGHALQDATEGAVQAAANRTRGYIKRAQQAVKGEESVEDWVLEARVRAAMGHVVADLKDVTVRAENGVIVLEGGAPSADAQELAACARHVRGVRDVDNRLRPAPVAPDVQGAQGESGEQASAG
jgi:hypothetical protein